MSCSVYQALRSLEHELSASLVAERARPRLLALANQLPELGGAQYLECRLGTEPSHQVDLLIAISRLQRRPEVPESAHSGTGMRPLRRLLAQWGRAGTSLHEVVPVVWVEFDDVMRQQHARANVCACIVPSYIDPMARLTSLPLEEQWVVLEELVEVIRGSSCSETERALLRRCVRLLPPGAHWIHLSVMTERNPAELKLYGAFPRHLLMDYLVAVGWPGPRSEIEQLVQRYCPPERTGDVLYVDLPLTRALERREPTIGICFSRQHLGTCAEADPSRWPLLRQLAHDGLCSPSQAEALAVWPRVAPERRTNPWGLERWFDVKVVSRAGEPLLAKAYLGFSSPASSQIW